MNVEDLFSKLLDALQEMVPATEVTSEEGIYGSYMRASFNLDGLYYSLSLGLE